VGAQKTLAHPQYLRTFICAFYTRFATSIGSRRNFNLLIDSLQKNLTPPSPKCSKGGFWANTGYREGCTLPPRLCHAASRPVMREKVRLYWMRTVNVYCVVSAMSGNPELGPKLRTISIAARRLNDAKVNHMRKAEKGERKK
jgi:hypothetical protein